MILVTGTGRCGTLSVHRQFQDCGLDSAHEPARAVTALTAAFWPGGGIPDATGLELLQRAEWAGDANCFWLYCTIMPLLDQMFPDARWLWVTRNAEDTVASMLHNRWWLPEDDDGWPVVVGWPAGRMFETAVPWRCRPNGYTLGDMSFREWRVLPQAGRCAWWWGWVWRTMRLRDGLRYPLEVEDPALLCDRLGLPAGRGRLYAVNRSEPPPLPAEARPWLERFCTDGMTELYPGMPVIR